MWLNYCLEQLSKFISLAMDINLRVKQLVYCYILYILVIAVICMNLLSSSPARVGPRTLQCHITPSSSIKCPIEPCLTLSQFAQNSSDLLTSNTTLIFLVGNHTLDIELYISHVSIFSMLTNSTGEDAHIVICQR